MGFNFVNFGLKLVKVNIYFVNKSFFELVVIICFCLYLYKRSYFDIGNMIEFV